MTAFLARLQTTRAAVARSQPLVLDGGLGSMLIARGLGRGEPPERWNLDRPTEVTAVHRAYVEAGSEAVHANTFGGNPIRLAAYGLADDCERINRIAVELARAAAPRFVIADVGPTGQYLPPVGQGDEQTWRSAFLTQARALAAAGVDALHIETMSDAKEAAIALEALQEGAPDIPVLVSLTFEQKRRGFFTIMGNPLVATLAELAQRGATAVGANCSITSDAMRQLVAVAVPGLAAEAPGVALVAQANAGQPQVTPDGIRYDQSPAAFAEDTAAMVRLGAVAVGGCCGTDPEFIRALCERLAALPADEAEESP